MDDTASKTEQGVKRSRESWFSKVTSLFNRSKIEEETWEELEELLIAADVGVATTGKLIQQVKQRVKEAKISEGCQVRELLKQEMVNLLTNTGNGKNSASQDKLTILLVIGVNGSGKTTSIAKLSGALKKQGSQVIIAAADTFRAAAIDQLKLWGERVGVPVIAHQPGADPGAVVFDAIQAAQNRKVQVVIVDTAGRLHTKFNLMEELKKIRRVIGKYDMSQEIILVVDATTGQNGLIQARHFTEAVGVNSIFLTKLDGTAKGGIVLAIRDELKIPISYIGTGEQVDDIVPFDPKAFVEAIFTD
jgi:fused signal recognition particle receptor